MDAGGEWLEDFDLEAWRSVDGEPRKDKVKIWVEYQRKPVRCVQCKVYGPDTPKCFKKNSDEAAKEAKERGTPFPSWTEIKYGRKKEFEQITNISEKEKEIVPLTSEPVLESSSPGEERNASTEQNHLAIVIIDQIPSPDVLCLPTR